VLKIERPTSVACRPTPPPHMISLHTERTAMRSGGRGYVLQQQPRLAELGGCDSLSLSLSLGAWQNANLVLKASHAAVSTTQVSSKEEEEEEAAAALLSSSKHATYPFLLFTLRKNWRFWVGYLVVHQVLHLGSLFWKKENQCEVLNKGFFLEKLCTQKLPYFEENKSSKSPLFR
jgi:hypothetical protein